MNQDKNNHIIQKAQALQQEINALNPIKDIHSKLAVQRTLNIDKHLSKLHKMTDAEFSHYFAMRLRNRRKKVMSLFLNKLDLYALRLGERCNMHPPPGPKSSFLNQCGTTTKSTLISFDGFLKVLQQLPSNDGLPYECFKYSSMNVGVDI